jgi:2-phospho-L-lactate guanylyltransferase
MDAGLVPIKRLDRAKARLAGRFDPAARAGIAGALVEDVFALMTQASFLSWWVVTDDAWVAARATKAGFAVVSDAGTGLNDALTTALGALRCAGATSVTVLPCDLPLATPADVLDIVDTGATSEVVLVPSEDGGTNALYLGPPGVIAPRFGPGSLRAHLAAAEAAGARCSLLSLSRLSLDLDTPEDVERFLARPASGHTHVLLRALSGS